MTAQYSVLTFNIRYSAAPDGPQHWDNRQQLVVERIQAHEPDLIGLQECRADGQAQYLQQHLPEYGFLGVTRDGSHESALEMAPILYKRSVFALLDSGFFWLSETPDLPGSLSWGSALVRTAAWARLQARDTQRQIVFLNTHFDHQSAAARLESAKLIRARSSQLAGDLPRLITGDFNAEKDAPEYFGMIADGQLYDPFRALNAPGEAENTFHGFGLGPHLAIDWILASRHFEPLLVQVDRWTRAGLYPSDHNPLRAILRLKVD